MQIIYLENILKFNDWNFLVNPYKFEDYQVSPVSKTRQMTSQIFHSIESMQIFKVYKMWGLQQILFEKIDLRETI